MCRYLFAAGQASAKLTTIMYQLKTSAHIECAPEYKHYNLRSTSPHLTSPHLILNHCRRPNSYLTQNIIPHTSTPCAQVIPR